jgi:hypothetical protein
MRGVCEDFAALASRVWCVLRELLQAVLLQLWGGCECIRIRAPVCPAASSTARMRNWGLGLGLVARACTCKADGQRLHAVRGVSLQLLLHYACGPAAQLCVHYML